MFKDTVRLKTPAKNISEKLAFVLKRPKINIKICFICLFRDMAIFVFFFFTANVTPLRFFTLLLLIIYTPLLR